MREHSKKTPPAEQHTHIYANEKDKYIIRAKRVNYELNEWATTGWETKKTPKTKTLQYKQNHLKTCEQSLCEWSEMWITARQKYLWRALHELVLFAKRVAEMPKKLSNYAHAVGGAQIHTHRCAHAYNDITTKYVEQILVLLFILFQLKQYRWLQSNSEC